MTVIHRKGEPRRYFVGAQEITEAEYIKRSTPYHLLPKVEQDLVGYSLALHAAENRQRERLGAFGKVSK